MRIETKLFKGKPVISFYNTPGKDFPDLTMGVKKAKIVLEFIDVLREFVKANEAAPTAETTETSA